MGRKDIHVNLLGFHAIRARMRAAPDTLVQVYFDEARRDGRVKALVAELKQAGVANVQFVAGRDLDGLAGGERHQGALAKALPRSQPDDLPSLLELMADRAPKDRQLLFLDGVTDPHNLGAILRSADGAGFGGVVAPKDHSAPLSDVAIRVSAGASDSMPYLRVTNLARAIEQAQDAGYLVLGLDDEGATDLFAGEWPAQPMVWVLGAEGAGLRRLVKEHCDEMVSLPMLGAVESLNVSVTAGVVCYESLRRRRNSQGSSAEGKAQRPR